MVIPRSCALVSLLPASCPAITTSVFLETEPAQFPPKNSIFSLASSRVMESSVPVSTKVRPVNTLSSKDIFPLYSKFTPTSFSFSINFLLSSSLK